MKVIDVSNCSDEVIVYINNLQKYINEKEKEIQDLKQKNDYLNDLEASAIEYKELKFQLQQKENIIKEVRKWVKKYSCQFTNDDGELVVSEISFNIQARPCDLFKILDKEVN